jgi:hypothetical protein
MAALLEKRRDVLFGLVRTECWNYFKAAGYAHD